MMSKRAASKLLTDCNSVTPRRRMMSGKVASKHRSKLIADISTYIGLIFYSLVLILPFIIIIITSFTSDYEIAHSIGFVWTPEFSLEGYEVLFTSDPYAIGGVPSILRGFINTLWITTIPTVVGLLVSGAAAFVYAKINVPGKNVLFLIEIATMCIPLGAFGMVSYLFYSAIGWQKSILPLIIPGMFGSASTIFFLRMYFEGINKEVIEAAKIDGVGTIGIYFRMMLPLSIPAFLAQFIFMFVGGYNDYQGPLLYLLGDKSMWTLQLAMSQVVSFVGSEGGYQNVQCAAALIGLVPMLILYCFVQKFFIEGIAVGGGKE